MPKACKLHAVSLFSDMSMIQHWLKSPNFLSYPHSFLLSCLSWGGDEIIMCLPFHRKFRWIAPWWTTWKIIFHHCFSYLFQLCYRQYVLYVLWGRGKVLTLRDKNNFPAPYVSYRRGEWSGWFFSLPQCIFKRMMLGSIRLDCKKCISWNTHSIQTFVFNMPIFFSCLRCFLWLYLPPWWLKDIKIWQPLPSYIVFLMIMGQPAAMASQLVYFLFSSVSSFWAVMSMILALLITSSSMLSLYWMLLSLVSNFFIILKIIMGLNFNI